MKASSICKAFALMSCPSAPTLIRDQIYSVLFIRPAWEPMVRNLFSFPPTTVVFQWFGIPKIRSPHQTRISPFKMCEFRATAVRYRKKNTTLKCRPRLKKYQTKIHLQTTVILTVASQHGLSSPAFVSLFFTVTPESYNTFLHFSQAMCNTCST